MANTVTVHGFIVEVRPGFSSLRTVNTGVKFRVDDELVPRQFWFSGAQFTFFLVGMRMILTVTPASPPSTQFSTAADTLVEAIPL